MVESYGGVVGGNAIEKTTLKKKRLRVLKYGNQKIVSLFLL